MVARLQGDTRGHAHLPYASSRWSQSAAVRSATATAFSARGARILMSQLGRVTTSMPLNPHTMSMSSCPARTRVGLRRAFWRPSRRARAKTLGSKLKTSNRQEKNEKRRRFVTRSPSRLGSLFVDTIVPTYHYTKHHLTQSPSHKVDGCGRDWHKLAPPEAVGNSRSRLTLMLTLQGLHIHVLYDTPRDSRQTKSTDILHPTYSMYLDTLLIPLERYILSSIERYKAFFQKAAGLENEESPLISHHVPG